MTYEENVFLQRSEYRNLVTCEEHEVAFPVCHTVLQSMSRSEGLVGCRTV
jgi:hypothetical protein